ncbi:N-acetyltransferase family protein [Gryllotalpicola daejeonensis]|uniref:GNAT family N-acetyltransferase n=1 Tax=Gryllotalpicola daejeonensis TaxID=993087 RepID=UPI0031E1749C
MDVQMTVGDVMIRPATAADAGGIREIRNDAILTSTAIWTGITQSMSEAAAWVDEHLERDSMVVAECDGFVLGYGCWAPWRAKEGYRFTAEDSVYLADGHRGRGIGALLLNAVIASARAAGMHTMIADIEAGNLASIALHQRLGFETIGTVKQAGTKFDRWLDLTILQLML